MKDILVIEDSPEIKILIESSLMDYNVRFCTTLKDGRKAIEDQTFQLIILDIGLPDGDGLKFLTELSAQPRTKGIPIMILSGKTETSNKIMAFSVGAEDFISKPFDPLELQARVNAKIKKFETTQSRGEMLKVADLQLDLLKQRVTIQTSSAAEALDLTTLEFKLLLCFARAPDRVFSRDYLLNEIWGSNINITDRTVDTHIGHLRKKIANSRAKIDTVVGAGYRFVIK